MFRSIADIDLFQLESISDFVSRSILSLDQLKDLLDETLLPAQLEQFVLDHLFHSQNPRATFRDEAILDLYTSILSDLLDWKTFHSKQLLAFLTLIQGLLCEIERNQGRRLNDGLMHACRILMGEKKPVLFNSQQYPMMIDYLIRVIFQHQHLYEILLEEQPQEIETIEENRTIDFHLFERPLFPYPLTEALPLSIYNEIVLQLPREDSSSFLAQLHQQYPNFALDELQKLFDEILSQ